MSSHEVVDWQLGCGQIRQRGAHLLASGLWADCDFLLGPDEVPVKAHKLILAMSSPVFQAMFYGAIAEGNAPIPIPDIQPDVFMKVLQYVYTDDIDLNDYIIGFELYYAAQKYMLPQLKTVCTAYLSGSLVPQNACKIYEFAEFIGDEELKAESLKTLLLHNQKHEDIKSEPQAKPYVDEVNDVSGVARETGSIRPGAKVAPTARISPSATIRPGCIVKDYVEVWNNAVVGPGAILKEYAVVQSHAVVEPGAILQQHAVVQSHARVGAGAIMQQSSRLRDYSRLGIGEILKAGAVK